MQGFQGLHYVQGFHVLGLVLQHNTSMPKIGGWEFLHFNLPNSKIQEFGLNKTVCLRISPFSGPRSTATLLQAITDTE